MAIPTYVNSINGYSEDSPYTEKGIAIDSYDIHLSTPTSVTIRTKFTQLANAMRILTVEETEKGDDYKMIIAPYTLKLTT